MGSILVVIAEMSVAIVIFQPALLWAHMCMCTLASPALTPLHFNLRLHSVSCVVVYAFTSSVVDGYWRWRDYLSACPTDQSFVCHPLPAPLH